MPARTSALLSLHLAVLLFGLSALFGRWLPLPAGCIVLGRAVFASLALATLATLKNEKLRLDTKSDYFILIGCGPILAFHWTAFFKSVQLGSVGIATLTFSTFPLMTALLEPGLFRERFELRTLVACVGASVGVLVLSWPAQDALNRGAGVSFDFGPGLGWGLASAASFAALSLINRRAVRTYPGQIVAFYQNAGAALCLLPFVVSEPVALAAKDLGLLLILGVFCTALAHTLYIQSLRAGSATKAGLVACLEPVYAIVLAALFLHEPLTLRVLISGALILGSATALPGKGS